ncbi:PAS domain-containing protein [Pseudokordiimonas caeni]|uniref:PAS domain-containing protein n=1 Tax=Pseudokordiimonas caeni TaxID=2997908 RepID=UPI002811D15C|nr:PAS domain-containing protein [Pseudokordiimonas caeni]
MHVIPSGTFEPLRKQWEHWRAQSGDPVPRKDQVDPKAIKQLLPYVSLIEIDGEGRVFSRLAGTFFRDLFGEEIAGKAVAVIRKYQGTGLFLPPAAFLAVVEQPCGMVSTRRFPTATGEAWLVHVMTLPLSGADGARNRGIYGIEMEREDGIRNPVLDVATLQIEEGSLLGYRFFDLGYGVPAAVGVLADALAEP